MKNYKDLLNELPSKTAVFAVGNFNPPNVGHELEIKVVRKLAKQRKADHFIFVSSVQDAKKNPLEISKKMQYLDLFFPNTKFIAKELPEAIQSLKKYKTVVAVTSSDYINEFKKSLKKYGFENVEVVSTGGKCPDSDDKLIKLASKGNYQSFKSGLPITVRELDAKRLMNDVRSGLDLEPIKEQINLVKDDLREQYFRGEIFNEGDIVESSDVVYKIIKRGSNHLLLQNEEGLKVSKWIQDVQLTERKFMLSFKQLLEGEHDTSTVAGKNRGVKPTNPAMQKAQAQSKAAQLAADEAEAKLKLQQEFERKKEILKTEEVESPVINKNSKYNIARSIMSMKDYKKSLGQTQPKEESPEQKDIADKIEDEMEGNTNIAPSINTLKRMKIKHHLGEGSYAHGFASPHGGLHQNKREDDEYHNEPKPAFKAKKLMDRPHTVHIDNKPWKEFSNGHQAHAAAKTLQGKGKNAVAIARFKEGTEYV